MGATLAMFAFKFPAMYQAGSLGAESQNIGITLLIVCSPYAFMLAESKGVTQLKALRINVAIFSALISLSGISILFVLIYVTPDAQNSVAVFNLVIIQWVAIGLFSLIEKILTRKCRATNT